MPTSRSRRAAATAITLATAAALAAGCGSGTTSSPAGSPTGPAGPAGLRAPATLAPATAWSQASGDAARTSPTTATGPRHATVRWQRKLEGAVAPGPAVGIDGSILAASNGGTLHALDPATGADRWTYAGGSSYGSDLSTTPAVLADGTILWPAPGNRLVALTSAGKLLWSQAFSGFVLSPAVVGGGRVYVGDMAGRISALDVGAAGAHSVAWTVELGGTSYSSPAVGPDGTVYGATDHDLVAIADHGTTGSIRWHFTAKDTVEVSPAVAPDGTIVLGTNADVEYGITPAGTVRWRFDKMDYSYSSPVVRNGDAYFGDHTGNLDVVSASTGATVRRELGLPPSAGRNGNGVGFWTAPLVDAKGDVYAGTAAGHVYGTGPDGTRLFDLPTNGATVASYPALTADGTLVIGAQDGTIYAISNAPRG